MSNSRITAAQHSHNSRITTAMPRQYQNDRNEVNHHHHLSIADAQIRGQAGKDIEAQRAARRAAMPITSAFLDEYAQFSPTVIYARENGITAGKREANESAFTIPPGYGIATNVPKVKK